MAPDRVEILLPVHNEAGTIETAIREMYAFIRPLVELEFIVCGGMAAIASEYLLCVDSDWRYDPKLFVQFWQNIRRINFEESQCECFYAAPCGVHGPESNL